ncbi:Phage terminase-like protein, large subunit, contains N-terminal HTH domain [Streptosporangium canum]|uniref:Phage terminase-like protein, large subunit, contains N-terminal HTH domain n=1 Tax=Streptosporangium canum TaxID=324952 RepID=A0A1I3LBJ5_9ACTN|nr:phage terminase family protein [Streptosporangium canum]SFI82078.1 Phage terminase-like protein, large subunit, contains N-terminal HTH domain [Streptosporangium canum]
MQSGNLPEGVPHPQRSLGYQILRWGERFLVQPDGENAGDPWQFTPEQKRFILWLYAIDERGKWLYDTACLRRSKGWGKTPVLAALAIIEFIGPARFSHFDEQGFPVGKRVGLPLIQIAATSIDQTANTRDMIRGMLANSPAEDEYDIEIGKERIQFRSGRPGRIEPVTSSSRGLEGARPTFVVGDETHHWVPSNGGVAVFEVLDRNVRKTAGAGSRYVESTNAFNPNEDSVAQRTYEAFLKKPNGRLLYDCIEADSEEIDLKDLPAVELGLKQAYGDSHWVDIQGLIEAIQDPRTSQAQAYRFYLNKIQESADAWMAKPVWDGLREDDDPIKAGDQIAIGFDGSLYSDATAIVGCRLRDGKLFIIHLDEDPHDPLREWQVDTLLVDKRMRQAQATYRVEWVYADPSYWQNVVGTWALDFKESDRDNRDIVFEFSPARAKQMCEAVERMHTAAHLAEDICHDGNPDLARHIANAVTYEVPQGLLIRKESKKSKKKIDAAIAAVLAYEARAEAIADGRMRVRRRARLRTY